MPRQRGKRARATVQTIPNHNTPKQTHAENCEVPTRAWTRTRAIGLREGWRVQHDVRRDRDDREEVCSEDRGRPSQLALGRRSVVLLPVILLPAGAMNHDVMGRKRRLTIATCGRTAGAESCDTSQSTRVEQHKQDVAQSQSHCDLSWRCGWCYVRAKWLMQN